MSGIRKALLFSILTQHFAQIINIFSIVILARLLTPAEVGVYALASSVAILAMELRSLGVGQFLIREKILNNEKIRSAIGVMVIISGGLAAVIVFTAPLIANFYGEQALMTLLWIIAASFLLAPFSTVPHALLTRDMKFQQLFLVKILSGLMLSGSTIALVLLGYSYYGLALGLLIGAITEFAAINYFRPPGTPWLPGFSGIRGLMRFGVYISIAQLFQRSSETTSDLVIGRVGNIADVGLFSRGLGLILFLNKLIVLAIGPVVLPYLSAIKRTEGLIAEAYLRVIVLQAAFSLPLFAIVNVAAFPIIRIMFGDQWDAAVPIASVLAIWAMLQTIHCLSPNALIVTGDEKLMFHTSLTVFLTRIIAVITASLVFVPFNLLAVSWAMVISGFIELIIMTSAIKRATGLKILHFIVSFVPNISIAVSCWFALIVLNLIMPFEKTDPWISVTIIGICVTIVWLAALRITKHEVWELIVSNFVNVCQNGIRSPRRQLAVLQSNGQSR